MKIEFTASLADSGSWFAPKKDGSGVLRMELSATEFSRVIQMCRFMDCFTSGGASFQVVINSELKELK